jgi:hypothetical protein
MKFPAILLALVALSSGASVAELGEVKTVYVLPMANGLDQYLAMRLTRGSSLQIVTDPQKADAILTEKIGAAFEETFNNLYGEVKKDKSKDKGDDVTAMRVQGGAKGKGAIFLVDRKTRNVLWSDFELPKSSRPEEMKRIADRIAEKFEKDKKGK